MIHQTKPNQTHSSVSLALAVSLFITAGTASASLEVRPGGMVYDTDLNITWLQDANLAATNTFGVSGIHTNGTMNWNTAQSWLAAMNTANYLGYNDWRLPTVSPVNGTSFQYGFSNNGSTDYGNGNTSPASELAYMFYVNLGNLGSCAPNGGGISYSCDVQSGWGLTNVGPFTNLQDVYWSGTVYAPSPDSAWLFVTYDGTQEGGDKLYPLYGWAVRSGDVAAVPLPAAVWLFGSSLVGLGLFRRRKGA